MTVTVLSMLLVMVGMWVSGAQAYCDFHSVVPMKDLDVNRFKGKWYISHMDQRPSVFLEAVFATMDIRPVSSSSATISLYRVEEDDRCSTLDGHFSVSHGVFSGVSGQLEAFRYRVIATDYTSIALVSSEVTFGGHMILVPASSIQIWVRTANQTPDLTSLASQLKAVCGEQAQELSFFEVVTRDYSATCSK